MLYKISKNMDNMGRCQNFQQKKIYEIVLVLFAFLIFSIQSRYSFCYCCWCAVDIVFEMCPLYLNLVYYLLFFRSFFFDFHMCTKKYFPTFGSIFILMVFAYRRFVCIRICALYVWAKECHTGWETWRGSVEKLLMEIEKQSLPNSNLMRSRHFPNSSFLLSA